MNIGTEIKKELIKKRIQKDCCKRAFFFGAMRGGGKLQVSQSGIAITISNTQESIINKCEKIINSITGIDAEISLKEIETSLGKRNEFELKVIDEAIKKLLVTTGINLSQLPIEENSLESTISDDCCFLAYISGLFLTGGAVIMNEGSTSSDQKSTGYLMEIIVADASVAKFIVSILETHEIHAKTRVKNNSTIVYIKDREQLCDFCAFLGVADVFFALQNIIITRDTRNDINRKVNCETGNIDRAQEAAGRQFEAAVHISMTIGLASLDVQLQEIAKARLQNPSSSIPELLKKTNATITKSGFNHRMRRLIAISDSLKNKDSDQKQ
ncbi:MAG: DNA-binding protein WhiA [Christensenellaceae bacterium]|jgi:DNA-binding protein WhiA|nr:DNA-binding protein WhiA [Christensenellaceae bacterium]